LTFDLVVKDAGVPQKTASAIVIANIENVNDESPVFELKSYEASVTENAPISTPGNPQVSNFTIKIKGFMYSNMNNPIEPNLWRLLGLRTA
jgi:hypothetical protein